MGVGRWVPLRSHDGFRGLDQSARSQCRWWDPRQGDRTPYLVSEKRVDLRLFELTHTRPSHIWHCARRYDDFLLLVTTIFFAIAPLAFAPTMGWGTPVLMMLLLIVYRGIIVLGTQLEEPFGLDQSDLPLTKFCQAIELQCLAVLARDSEIFTFDKTAALKSAAGAETSHLGRRSLARRSSPCLSG